MFEIILIAYIILINLTGFVMMGTDKHRARHQQRRIPEKQLFACALLGGSIGSLVGMMVWHHKTKHLKFTLGMPAVLLAQAAVIAFALYFYVLPCF